MPGLLASSPVPSRLLIAGLLAAATTSACAEEPEPAPITAASGGAGANSTAAGAPAGSAGAPGFGLTAGAGGMNMAGNTPSGVGGQNTGGIAGQNAGGVAGQNPSGNGGQNAGGAGGTGGSNMALVVACDPAAAGKPELNTVLSLRADPSAGELDYLDACGFCHGSDGEGKTTGDFTSSSLNSLEWTCEQVEIAMNGKPNTAMLGFLEDRGAQWVADKIAYTQVAFTKPRP